MNKLVISLDIALKEQRHDFVCSTTAQVMTFLENQGFTFDEVLDGLVNYAWVNAYSVDTVFGLAKASLSARKKHHPDGIER
ncbi:MAG: hypothetical protein HWQ38_37995 [Nostoc sp. NMS7]|uniref:hypothetical protein n=1 Tax=Nostoc sp. NMS7 TaxID=2815391 RepID=UPI0025D1AEDB|nr:hypothetical protein [Nostoc sp. NMS7]MBN3951951.1 hypothetical protein [Nostoc sp. NMS7]